MDEAIKSNLINIASEVVRTQEKHRLQRNGTSFIRELWREHRILADVVKDFGMAFRKTGDNGREINCPVCFQYRDGTVDVAFSVNQRLSKHKKSIARHLESSRHKIALEEQERALLLVVRRSRVGLTIAIAALMPLREGCNYLQFEKKVDRPSSCRFGYRVFQSLERIHPLVREKHADNRGQKNQRSLA